MKNTNLKIRTDARVAAAVALAGVPLVNTSVTQVMRSGTFTADPQTDRG